jgi:hypothetical protein
MPHLMSKGALLLTLALGLSCAGAGPRGDAPALSATIVSEAPGQKPIATASAADAPAPAAVAPPMQASQRDPVSLRVGDRVLQIAFKPGPIGFVSAIADGDVALAVPRLRSKDASGRGDDLVLIDHVERDSRAYALFAATTHGSPECGSYGFWALRLDAKGVRKTPMIEGCFLSVGDGHPKITWSDPALLVLESPHYQAGASVEVFSLDEQGFAFRSRVRTKVPD